jgi:copper chaperone CopZ
MTQATLSVPGISCGQCERAITSALTPVAGVQRIEVDIPRKQVRVEYDAAAVSLDQVTAILAEEDYPVAATELASGQHQMTTVPVSSCSCCSPRT